MADATPKSRKAWLWLLLLFLLLYLWYRWRRKKRAEGEAARQSATGQGIGQSSAIVHTEPAKSSQGSGAIAYQLPGPERYAPETIVMLQGQTWIDGTQGNKVVPIYDAWRNMKAAGWDTSYIELVMENYLQGT